MVQMEYIMHSMMIPLVALILLREDTGTHYLHALHESIWDPIALEGLNRGPKGSQILRTSRSERSRKGSDPEISPFGPKEAYTLKLNELQSAV